MPEWGGRRAAIPMPKNAKRLREKHQKKKFFLRERENEARAARILAIFAKRTHIIVGRTEARVERRES